MKLKNTMIEAEARRLLRKPYSWILVPQEEGGYSAEILEFPGCYAEGETADEAYRNLADAAQTWVELCLEKEEAIPAPLTNDEVSGKFALRLPRSVYARATKFATQDGVSLNQFIVECVAERLGAMSVLNRVEAAIGEIRRAERFVRIAELESEAVNTRVLPLRFTDKLHFSQEATNPAN